jgi:hypothetical protein
MTGTRKKRGIEFWTTNGPYGKAGSQNSHCRNTVSGSHASQYSTIEHVRVVGNLRQIRVTEPHRTGYSHTGYNTCRRNGLRQEYLRRRIRLTPCEIPGLDFVAVLPYEEV